jgi:uncharacterized protein
MLDQEQLNKDLKKAMQEKNHTIRGTITLLKSKIKNKEIELKRELKEDEIIKIIKKEKKEVEESLEAFRKGNRDELVKEQETILAYLDKYLPAPLSEADIIKILEDDKVDKEQNEGKMIGYIMKNYDNADAPIVKKAVEAYKNK